MRINPYGQPIGDSLDWTPPPPVPPVVLEGRTCRVEPLEPRHEGQGAGWQTSSRNPSVGVHQRGRGPGDSFSLPYFAVDDLAKALEQVEALGGSVVHPGESWAICKDSEGSPFGLAGGVFGSTS